MFGFDIFRLMLVSQVGVAQEPGTRTRPTPGPGTAPATAPAPLPPPLSSSVEPLPLSNIPEVNTAILNLAGFKTEAQSALNSLYTRGRIADSNHIPDSPDQRRRDFRFGSQVEFYHDNFANAEKAGEKIIAAATTIKVPAGLPEDPAGTFGQLSATERDIAQMRRAWIDQQLKPFDDATRSAGNYIGRLGDLLSLAKDDKKAPDYNKYDAWIKTHSREQGFGPSEKLREFNDRAAETREVLAAKLAEYYDTKRPEYVLSETRSRQVALVRDTLNAHGVPAFPPGTTPEDQRSGSVAPSHWVVQKGDITLHFRQGAVADGVQQWEYQKVASPSAAATDTGWKPVATPLDQTAGSAEHVTKANEMLAAINKRQSLAPTYPSDFQPEFDAIRVEARQVREDLIRSNWQAMLTGRGGEALGFKFEPETKIATYSGATVKAEVQLSNSGWIYRYAHADSNGRISLPSDPNAGWQQVSTEIPEQDTRTRNPWTDELRNLQINLALLRTATTGNSTNSVLAAFGSNDIPQTIAFALNRGQSGDSGREFLVKTFAATRLSAETPGTLSATIDGVNLLFRRRQTVLSGAEQVPLEASHPHYGLWEVAVKPTAPNTAPTWSIITADNATASDPNDWRNFGGIKGNDALKQKLLPMSGFTYNVSHDLPHQFASFGQGGATTAARTEQCFGRGELLLKSMGMNPRRTEVFDLGINIDGTFYKSHRGEVLLRFGQGVDSTGKNIGVWQAAYKPQAGQEPVYMDCDALERLAIPHPRTISNNPLQDYKNDRFHGRLNHTLHILGELNRVARTAPPEAGVATPPTR